MWYYKGWWGPMVVLLGVVGTAGGTTRVGGGCWRYY